MQDVKWQRTSHSLFIALKLEDLFFFPSRWVLRDRGTKQATSHSLFAWLSASRPANANLSTSRVSGQLSSFACLTSIMMPGINPPKTCQKITRLGLYIKPSGHSRKLKEAIIGSLVDTSGFGDVNSKQNVFSSLDVLSWRVVKVLSDSFETELLKACTRCFYFYAECRVSLAICRPNNRKGTAVKQPIVRKS